MGMLASFIVAHYPFFMKIVRKCGILLPDNLLLFEPVVVALVGFFRLVGEVAALPVVGSLNTASETASIFARCEL